MTESGRPVHIQRCTYMEYRRGTSFQCKLRDPHPDVGHQLPIDAQFGVELDTQNPVWLAATLRDQVALREHTQQKVNQLQAIAMDLVSHWMIGYGELRPETADWVRANHPTAAAWLGIE